MFSFYTPWKHQKTFGFLVFSEGIKKETFARNGLSNKATPSLLLDHLTSILDNYKFPQL